MKERPILFSAPMVRALLSGTKTQTRRVVKPRKDRQLGCTLAANELAGEINAGRFDNSPYGQPGDRLWVREAFSRLEAFDFFSSKVPDPVPDFWYWADGDPTWGDWTGRKPSIHMPRAACRIVLEITAVRVEKLHDISEADCVAEGIGLTEHAVGVRMTSPTARSLAVAMYKDLWDTINRANAWEVNPWVWAVEFKRSDT